MRLFIAEKPSLGRAIAAVLPKPHEKGEGYIRAANGDCVSWCIGHILEQAEPETYDPKFKKWQLTDLPIIPEQWVLKPKSKTRSQLAVLRKLVNQATLLVHAGDPDREGQLLVDEVLHYFKLSQTKLAQVQRCLINDLNPKAVQRSIEKLASNQDYVSLSVSALARSRADWLYGINMTRAYTLQGQKAGFQGVLSVGRVQTPVLGLVVKRDQIIENFVSKPFYDVYADILTKKNESFKATWVPSEACHTHMDEEGRVLNPKLAQNVVQRIKGQPAIVLEATTQTKKQYAPLPFNLSALQIEAGKRFGFSAKNVLDSCQQLYERHQLITYPRSDCRYLPDDHYSARADIVKTLSYNNVGLDSIVPQADLALKSKAWDSKKVGAHHAIIPTEKRVDLAILNRMEQSIYKLIAQYYLAQFFPPYEYLHQFIALEIVKGRFEARATKPMKMGWKVIFSKLPEGNAPIATETQEGNSVLPDMIKGDNCTCVDASLVEKTTQPPAYFTDATLLAAMTGINRYVHDVSLKKVLKDTDGLGTEATRAGIIELLFTRGFLVKQGKQIQSTSAGKALIHALPLQAVAPDMTAHWEMTLNAITEKKVSYDAFMQPMVNTLTTMIDDSKELSSSSLTGIEGVANVSRRRKKRTIPRKKSTQS